MIFNFGVVPDSSCIGMVSPILKKNKPKSCLSYRPVTVSSVFAKIFDLLIVAHLKEKFTLSIMLVPITLYVGYIHLKDCLKSGNVLLDSKLSVFVGIKQGAITFPTICNNAPLPVQIGLPICLHFKRDQYISVLLCR